MTQKKNGPTNTRLVLSATKKMRERPDQKKMDRGPKNTQRKEKKKQKDNEKRKVKAKRETTPKSMSAIFFQLL